MDVSLHGELRGIEERRWPRYKIDVRLKISYENAGHPAYAFGRANNLSHGGLGAYIPCAIPIGATVALELTFPHSTNEVKLNAIIRSCEGFRYGLEFIRVPSATQAVILKSCDTPELLQ